jgi:uncharacterized protein
MVYKHNLGSCYQLECVTFDSHGVTVMCNLYLPQGLERPAPTVALLGPQTFVKGQAPTQYAKRLDDDGFVALAFESAMARR